MEFDLKTQKEFYLKIKVLPNAPKTELKNVLKMGDEEVYKIAVSAPPEKNKANKKLIAFLAKTFNVDLKNVKIISGASSKIKLIKISK